MRHAGRRRPGRPRTADAEGRARRCAAPPWCWSTTWWTTACCATRADRAHRPRRQARRLRQHAAGLHPQADGRRGRRGERVVRLKGGDPFVFGRGGEECDALRAAGIEVEVVSGLTAGIAGAGGHRHAGHRPPPRARRGAGHRPCRRTAAGEPDWAALARSGLTLVIYMGVARSAEQLCQRSLTAAWRPTTPAAVISRRPHAAAASRAVHAGHAGRHAGRASNSPARRSW